MLRITLVCLIALAVQISALPEHIENLDHDLSALPNEYKHIATEINTKRAAGDEHGYCCTNWQHVNNDEVVTKMQSTLVPKTHIVTTGYKDCHGNLNPTRPPIVLSSTSKPSLNPIVRPTQATGGSVPTATGCMWTAITKLETYMSTEFQVVTQLVPNSHSYCAPADYKCCPGFVLLNDNCVDQSVVANLEFLMQLGLVGGIGKK